MPQFDQFSFFNQVSWFLFFFFLFYFLLTYFILSKIGYHLKFRKKRMMLVINNQKQLHTERNVVHSFLNSFYNLYCCNLGLCMHTQDTPQHVFKLINPIVKEEMNFKLNQKFLLFKNY